MRIRVSGMALKSAVAIVGLTAGAALSGCTTMGSAMNDPTITGSVSSANGSGNLNQPMPSNLGVGTQVAANQFVPPANVGGGNAPYYSGSSMSGGGYSPMPPMTGAQPGSVTSSDLPSLSSSPSNGMPTAMPVQSSVAPVAATPATSLGSLPAASSSQASAPNLSVVPQDAYVHVVESGESLYTIARRYDVTAQAIMKANGSLAPDKIYVGQKLVIPGRPDLVANRSPAQQFAPSLPAQQPVVQPAQTAQAQQMPVDSSVPTMAAVTPVAASPRPSSRAPQQAQQVAALQPSTSQAMPAKPAPQQAQTPQAAAAQTLQTAAVQPNKPASVLYLTLPTASAPMPTALVPGIGLALSLTPMPSTPAGGTAFTSVATSSFFACFSWSSESNWRPAGPAAKMISASRASSVFCSSLLPSA